MFRKTIAALNICVVLAPEAAVAQPEVLPIPGVSGNLADLDGNGWPEINIFVEGPFAQELYNLMPVDPVDDVCGEGLVKSQDSGVNCSKSTDGRFICSFGYDVGTQRMTHGPMIC